MSVQIFAYVSLYIICVFLSYFGQKYSNLRFAALFLVAVIVAVVVGFRPIDVGIDTQNYHFLYEQVFIRFEGTWMESQLGYIFYYLSLFSKFIGGNGHYLTFIYALLSCFFFFYTFHRCSSNIILSVACFFSGLGFFLFMHNVMRQALAISIIFYSISFIVNRNTLKFYATVFLATLVHASAVFFIPFYFLARLPVNSYFLLLVWVSSLPFIYFSDLIVIVLEIFTFIIPSVYIHYIESQHYFEIGGVSGLGLALMIKQCFFLLMWLAYRKDSHLDYNRAIYLLVMYAVIVGNFVLGLGVVGRFNLYLFVFIALGLPMAVNALIKKQRRIAFLIVWIVLTATFLKDLLSGSHGVIV